MNAEEDEGNGRSTGTAGRATSEPALRIDAIAGGPPTASEFVLDDLALTDGARLPVVVDVGPAVTAFVV